MRQPLDYYAEVAARTNNQPPLALTRASCTCAGVIKRVALLLLVLSALGIVLFFVGFKYAFPEAR